MVVSSTLTSTVLYGFGYLLKVITVHVSHDRIDHAVALPHNDRPSGDGPDVRAVLTVRERVLLHWQ